MSYKFYEGQAVIDRIVDGKLLIDQRVRMSFSGYQKCIRELLLKVLDSGNPDQDEELCIGISWLKCDDQPVNQNYIHKVIRDDVFLKERYWY